MTPLTIIAYHYIRDLERSRYPAIKGRRITEFRAQLDYIAGAFTVVTAEHVIAALKGDASLPNDAAWLTFDDGYIDHHRTVLPLLRERGWQGSFFPVATASRDYHMLDVNKLHFVLAAEPDANIIVRQIEALMLDREGLRPFTEYWRELAMPGRYDTAEVTFIKRLLQRALPQEVRSSIVHALFLSGVTSDETAFAADLYASTDHLREMVDCGMYVGSHSARHLWMDSLDPASASSEIDESLSFLDGVGARTRDWVMCYPYGASSPELRAMLREKSCAAGLTVRPANAGIGTDDPMLLPRRDTNEFPIS
jgi:peptidoglycan/xylan/chitin deacetylase (PgdA/CDA1 family)